MTTHRDVSSARTRETEADAQRLRRMVETALPGAQIVRPVGHPELAEESFDT